MISTKGAELEAKEEQRKFHHLKLDLEIQFRLTWDKERLFFLTFSNLLKKKRKNRFLSDKKVDILL